MLLKVKGGKEKEILNKLSRVKGFLEGHIVFGDYDIVGIYRCKKSEVSNLVSKVRRMKGILLMSTLISK